MEVKPLKSFVKTLAPAPDKSVTHRAIMLNSVARGKAEITNALHVDNRVHARDGRENRSGREPRARRRGRGA